MKTYKAGELREDMLVVPAHELEPATPSEDGWEVPDDAETIAFVLRQIGSLDAEDITGDDVDLRFEDADGRDTGCDVSIVEYAEKAADLIEQHSRIVAAKDAEISELRALIAHN